MELTAIHNVHDYDSISEDTVEGEPIDLTEYESKPYVPTVSHAVPGNPLTIAWKEVTIKATFQNLKIRRIPLSRWKLQIYSMLIHRTL